MNKLFLIILTSLIFSFQVTGQIESFVYWNNDGYSSEWIKFFRNGRFELVHDEQCYAYTMGAGVYKDSNDSVQIEFFRPMCSKSEIVKTKSNDGKIDITIFVFSLQDSSKISTATVFARDTSIQQYELTEKVDTNGIKTFYLPKGKTIKYLKVYADNYVDCELVFNENFESDCTINIYLSEDPLLKNDYKGAIFDHDVMIRKGKNQIVYKGKLYKRNKNGL